MFLLTSYLKAIETVVEVWFMLITSALLLLLQTAMQTGVDAGYLRWVVRNHE